MTMSRLFAHVKATDGDDPNGSFEVVLSAPTLDRDGEVIDAGAFEPLPDHITFDIDHGLSTATTVGSGRPFYDGDLLKVAGSFSSIPRAQEVRTLVTEGHIRTTSVAYMGARSVMKDGVKHVTKAELLNGAFVAVPANREAVVLAAKTLGLEPAAAKTIDGSWEARRDLLRDAVREMTDSWWVAVVATFDDRVVWETEDLDGAHQWEAAYEIGPDGVSVGEAHEIEVVEVVAPKDAKTGARNSAADLGLLQTIHDHTTTLGASCATKDPDAAPEDKAAAPAPAERSPAADVRVTARRTEAEIHLLLLQQT